jgi:type IV pilus assembly protein PilB
LVTPSDVDLVLRKYTPFSDEVQAAVQALKIRPGQFESSFSKIIQLESGTTVSGEAPIIRIVSALLKEAVGIGASDIHIEPQRTFLRVRFRVDGDLKEVLQLPMELEQPVVSRVKVLSNLRIDETRIPQDGRFRTVIYGKEIDFRVATFPTPAGEKVSLRVLDPSVGLKSLTDLGLSDYNIDIIKKEIERPYGMILLTGPTGSGKSTTLYALMQLLNKENVNIVSLEDPVEYTIDGPNQSQVRPEIGYDFASGLRQILRQDPDIIMVGEIRDGETASLAVHSALTGHLVLSTLHTNNAIGVIPRLVDMKVDSFLLPYTINLMAAQRLVPRLCQKCKTAKEPAAALMKVLKKEIAEMPERTRNKIKEPMKAYYSPGCAACKNKGVAGRVAIFEAFTMTPELADLIAAGISENKIAEEAKRQGMVTMRQDGILKALNGLIGLEDVLKEGEGVSLV